MKPMPRPVIKIVPTAGGLALVTPRGYEFLVYESGHTISAPERSKFRPKTHLPRKA